jgi:hypothetical protein
MEEAFSLRAPKSLVGIGALDGYDLEQVKVKFLRPKAV